MNATPLPVSIALAGHMSTCWLRNVIATSSTAQVPIATRICAIESWKSNGDLPEDLQRDDHRGEVQPRIGELRQQHRIAAASDHERRSGRAGAAVALIAAEIVCPPGREHSRRDSGRTSLGPPSVAP